jgi:hypothetical protein
MQVSASTVVPAEHRPHDKPVRTQRDGAQVRIAAKKAGDGGWRVRFAQADARRAMPQRERVRNERAMVRTTTFINLTSMRGGVASRLFHTSSSMPRSAS